MLITFNWTVIIKSLNSSSTSECPPCLWVILTLQLSSRVTSGVDKGDCYAPQAQQTTASARQQWGSIAFKLKQKKWIYKLESEIERGLLCSLRSNIELNWRTGTVIHFTLKNECFHTRTVGIHTIQIDRKANRKLNKTCIKQSLNKISSLHYLAGKHPLY